MAAQVSTGVSGRGVFALVLAKAFEVIFAKSAAFQFASIECYETLSRCENG
jgi:hypothetical protein